MAKIRQTIGNASLDVDGDEACCTDAARQFHLALAEAALRDVELRLAELRPLQKHRRELAKYVAELKAA